MPKKYKLCQCCHKRILNIGSTKRCSNCSLHVADILRQMGRYKSRCKKLEDRLMLSIKNPKMRELIEKRK